MKPIEARLQIRYKWDPNNANGVDFSAFGESLIGIDHLFKNYINVLHMKGDVQIQAESAREGSVIIDLLIQLHTVAPFLDWQAYRDFMQLVGEKIPTSDMVWSNAELIHRSVNDYVAKNPVDFALFSYAFVKLFKWGSLQKNKITIEHEKNVLPVRHAKGLYKLVKEHQYKKVLSPIINESVSEMGISAKHKESFVIDLRNFSNYLSEDERILPEYKNGFSYKFKGEIVGLESSRGEHLRFRAIDLPRPYRLLTAYPEFGKESQNYVEYYKKPVLITAEITRKSEYHRPKLKIEEIKVIQKTLNLQ
ncbi:MAG: hypothetical protein WCT49_01135 [Candidatus Paceibacterota bacterium]|jgi:hypothetical protein|nr:hypothetical protein [Candidatus Paceibacterota bacterium]